MLLYIKTYGQCTKSDKNILSDFRHHWSDMTNQTNFVFNKSKTYSELACLKSVLYRKKF